MAGFKRQLANSLRNLFSRSQMKIRFNFDSENWEVYTYLAGTNLTVWKWFIITEDQADYYISKLKAERITYERSKL